MLGLVGIFKGLIVGVSWINLWFLDLVVELS